MCNLKQKKSKILIIKENIESRWYCSEDIRNHYLKKKFSSYVGKKLSEAGQDSWFKDIA